jgi:hypothetical protein
VDRNSRMLRDRSWAGVRHLTESRFTSECTFPAYGGHPHLDGGRATIWPRGTHRPND